MPFGGVDVFVAVKASTLHMFQQTSTTLVYRFAESKGLPDGRALGPEPDSSSCGTILNVVDQN